MGGALGGGVSPINSSVAISAKASLTAAQMKKDAYTEAGGDAALSYDDKTQTRAEGRLGLEFSTGTALGTIPVQPFFYAGLTQSMGSDKSAYLARFANGSAKFRTDTPTQNGTGYEAQLGFTGGLGSQGKGARYTFAYNHSSLNDSSANQLAGTLRIGF